jgi:hypothetical protein
VSLDQPNACFGIRNQLERLIIGRFGIPPRSRPEPTQVRHVVHPRVDPVHGSIRSIDGPVKL